MDGLTLGCDLINLRSKVSRATAESSKAIDNVISWSRRSDFSVSQDDWQEHADILNWKLHKTLSRRQELINQLETERDANDEEGSDLEISTGTTDVSQDQHDGQPVTGPSNRYEDIRRHRMLADLPNGVMFREGLYDGIGSLIKLLKTIVAS
ncbi:hypothetical protein MJO29_001360 [Puccinia striiformis f. sp. tritici]|nr:hypothetical protein MJO29_001360 [Puccinia striiformis f. sp. tritici]